MLYQVPYRYTKEALSYLSKNFSVKTIRNIDPHILLFTSVHNFVTKAYVLLTV